MSAPYMPLFVSDYLSHTQHLSAAEHGAYMLLIMNYWQREKPLPADPRKLARIARMSDAEWAEASESLSEFFQEVDGAWVHKRIEEEITKAAEKIEKAKANGKLGGRPPKKQPGGNPPVSGSEPDAKLLDDMRLAEISKDASLPASLDAGQRDEFVEFAEASCIEAAGSTSLGPFLPIAGLLLDGTMSLDNVVMLIRARPAAAGGVLSWKFYVKVIRDEAATRPSGSQGPPKVFIAKDTPEWDAWQAAEPGKHKAVQMNAGMGCYVATRFPTPLNERERSAA